MISSQLFICFTFCTLFLLGGFTLFALFLLGKFTIFAKLLLAL